MALRLGDGRIAWSFPSIEGYGARRLTLSEELQFDATHTAIYVDRRTGTTYRVKHLFSIRPDSLAGMEAFVRELDGRLTALFGPDGEAGFCPDAADPVEQCYSCIGLVLSAKYSTSWPARLLKIAGSSTVQTSHALSYWIELAGESKCADVILEIFEGEMAWNPLWWSRYLQFANVLMIHVVRAVDPNEKVGAPGAGDGRFLALEIPLTYEIDFENLATATAPAQEVVITDDLDAAIDPDSIDLGAISFATSATFAGRDGVGYRFYSVATDEVGNVEEAPAGPDTATRVSVTTTSSGSSEQHGDGGDDSSSRALENVRAPRRITLRQLKRKGILLRLVIGAPQTRLTGTVAITRTRARGRVRPRTVARFQSKELAPGLHRLDLRLTRAGFRRVKKSGATQLEVQLIATAPGADSVGTTRRVKLRR